MGIAHSLGEEGVVRGEACPGPLRSPPLAWPLDFAQNFLQSQSRRFGVPIKIDDGQVGRTGESIMPHPENHSATCGKAPPGYRKRNRKRVRLPLLAPVHELFERRRLMPHFLNKRRPVDPPGLPVPKRITMRPGYSFQISFEPANDFCRTRRGASGFRMEHGIIAFPQMSPGTVHAALNLVRAVNIPMALLAHRSGRESTNRTVGRRGNISTSWVFLLHHVTQPDDHRMMRDGESGLGAHMPGTVLFKLISAAPEEQTRMMLDALNIRFRKIRKLLN